MAQTLASSAEALSLPSGGGQLSGLGESFTPNLQTGSGNFSVPIACPDAQNGLRPDITLGYTTGGGNGPFGQGFRVPLMTIGREMSAGVPTYDDSLDRFHFSDGGRLVDCGRGRFRPEVDQAHWLIERTGDFWKVTTKDGTLYRLGSTANARIQDEGRIFRWLVDRIVDPNGLEIRYQYREEGTQRYIERISYGPFEVRFEYASRPDSFVTRRAGFAIYTTLRGTWIRVISHREDERELRRYALEYNAIAPRNLSLLSRITLSAGEREHSVSMPAVSLKYTPLSLDPGSIKVFATPGDLAPPALSEPNVALVDLAGDGLPDVIATDDFGTTYWQNLGGSRFAQPRRIRSIPGLNPLGDANLRFSDMEGNGTADLLQGGRSPGFLPNAAGLDWEPFVPYQGTLPFDLSDPNLRLVDIDGDGKIDAAFSRSDAFVLFRNLGRKGWDPTPLVVPRRNDLDQWPDVSFASEAVRFADMTGDGLLDIVLVENGRISYWPYYGEGRWGEREGMESSPILPRDFQHSRLQLVDIDGDGAADLVFFDQDSLRIWINRDGARFSAEQAVAVDLPLPDRGSFLIDATGRGRTGLLVSNPSPNANARAFRYIRLGAVGAPFLMTEVDNGLGAVTSITYDSVEHWRGADRQAGNDWRSFLPFPVQTVSSIRVSDRWSGVTATTRFRYRDGHYDGEERAFRGFGHVEEVEEGDAWTPGVLRKYQFSVGADLSLSEAERRKLSSTERLQQRALTGAEILAEIYDLSADGTPNERREQVEHDWEIAVLERAEDRDVLTRREREKRTTSFDGNGPAKVLISRNLTFDEQGDVLERESIGGKLDGRSMVEDVYLKETMTFARSAPGAHGFRRKALCELRRTARDGNLLALKRHYYDGPSFKGLALGELQRGNLIRTEVLALDETQIRADFPAADLEALGYHRTASDDNQSWFIDAERFERDANGVVVATRGPLGETVRITFDPLGIQPVHSVNAAGHETHTEVDPAAETLAVFTHPSGHRERRIFDALGRTVAVTKLDNDGNEWLQRIVRYELSEGSQPSRIVNIVPRQPLNPDALAGFQQQRLEAIADAFIQVVYYDGTGEECQRRVTAERAADGAFRAIVSGVRHRNRRGFVYREDAPLFRSNFAYAPTAAAESIKEFLFTRDWQGRIIRSERIGQAPRITSYSPWQSEAWDERSANAGMRSRRVEGYDAWGRLVRVDEEDSLDGTRTTRYDLDTLGRLKCVRDAAGRVTVELRHDTLGRRLGTVQTDAGRRVNLLNAGGRAVEVLAPEGRLRMGYDAINRLTELHQIRDAGDRLLRRYHYDKAPQEDSVPFLLGRVARVSDESGDVVYRYNRVGQRVSKTRRLNDGRELSLRVDYAFTGEVRSLTYPSRRRIQLEYNEAGLLERIPGVVEQTTYRVDGRISAREFASGVKETYEYDGFDRLRRFKVQSDFAETHLELNYAYGAGLEIGTIERATASGKTAVRFEYDGFNQLRQAADEDHAAQFNYDELGNVIETGREGNTTLFYDNYSHPNRVTRLLDTSGEQILDYDGSGRITALRHLKKIRYDLFGRLTAAERDDGGVVEYDYGHELERVRKRVTKEGTTRETLFFDDLFEEADGHSRCHIVVGGSFLGTLVSDGNGQEDVLIHHTDHLGSSRLITNGTGEALAAPNHSAYGRPEADSNQDSVFIGRDFDPDLGLHFLQTRFYDPVMGRFITPDPTVLDNPQDFVFAPRLFNPYAYAINNPVRYRDPNGRFAVLAAVIVGAAVGGFLGYQAAKEQGKNPWSGALIGAVVGGLLGYAGGFSLLHSAATGSLTAGASTVGFALLSGNEVENLWTSMAIGFAFGGIGHMVGTWEPVSGSGFWVDSANVAKEIAIDAAVGGLRGLATAAISDGDLKSGFFEGAIMGAAFSVVKIAAFGVRYDPLSGKSGQQTGVEAQVRSEYQRQSLADNSHLKSEIQRTKFPEMKNVQFRRHGLIPALVSQIPGRGGSIVLGDNVNMSHGEQYRVNTIAHELRHIHQQQLNTFGTTEFLIRYLFLQDHNTHYDPGTTSYEPPY